MKCYCGKDWEGTSATPYMEAWMDKECKIMGGTCLHGDKFGITFDEWLKIQQDKIKEPK